MNPHEGIELWDRGIELLGAQLKNFDSLMTRASARVHLERASRARDAQDWARMLNALSAIALLTHGHVLGTEGMRVLVGLMACVIARGDLRQEALELVENNAKFAWSETTSEHTPLQWLNAFELASRYSTWRTAVTLADALGRAYPTWALAPYAGAHFRERAKLAVGELSPRRMNAHARRFGQAHALATLSKETRLEQHCVLRQGVALMLGGQDIAQARRLLKGIKVPTLSPHEKLWYAIGMSHSTFWLDRVRAADAIDDLARALKRQRIHGIEHTHIQAAVGYLFEREGVDVHDAEEDRLSALIEEAFEGQDQERMHHALSVRMQLRAHHTRPLDQAQRITEVLDAQASTSEAWRRSASSFSYLQRFATQDASEQEVESIPTRAPDVFLDGAHMALTLLHAVARQKPSEVEASLRTIRARLREDERLAQHRSRLRPLSSAWPKTLEWVRAWSAHDQSDPAHVEVLLEVLDDAMEAWASIAPEPSYGWWALGAHTLTLGAHASTRACARRGVDSRQALADGGKARDHVLGKILDQVVRDADPVDMQLWLERAESIYASTTK